MIGGQRKGLWAQDLDAAITMVRARAGSMRVRPGTFFEGGHFAAHEDYSDLPDLVPIDDQAMPSIDKDHEAFLNESHRNGLGKPPTWDSRPKPDDWLVFDPLLGVVPTGVVKAREIHKRRRCGACSACERGIFRAGSIDARTSLDNKVSTGEAAELRRQHLSATPGSNEEAIYQATERHKALSAAAGSVGSVMMGVVSSTNGRNFDAIDRTSCVEALQSQAQAPEGSGGQALHSSAVPA